MMFPTAVLWGKSSHTHTHKDSQMYWASKWNHSHSASCARDVRARPPLRAAAHFLMPNWNKREKKEMNQVKIKKKKSKTWLLNVNLIVLFIVKIIRRCVEAVKSDLESSSVSFWNTNTLVRRRKMPPKCSFMVTFMLTCITDVVNIGQSMKLKKLSNKLTEWRRNTKV